MAGTSSRREGAVDHRLRGRERAVHRRRSLVGEAIGRPCRAEVRFHRRPLCLGDVKVGKSRMNRVRRSHPCARQSQEFSNPARSAGQKEAAADIGDQSDGAFRHGDLGRLACDAVAGVAGEADAAAHDEALHEDDDGLR